MPLHSFIERRIPILLLLTLLVVAIGGVVEIVPLFYLDSTLEKVEGVRPYTPLELAGRNIYVREGCYNCHSQQIRPLRDEVERYGPYSLAAESMYDHPFQWGSKRTGPDLARVGGRYSDSWHVEHLINPRALVPESVMPGYPFLANTPLDFPHPEAHLRANARLGVPYDANMIAVAKADLSLQASPQEGADEAAVKAFLSRYPKAQLRDFDGNPKQVSEMDALVAYLQMLGRLVDFKTYEPQRDLR
jgi:cytochrome c oxidase cbb3-type subunit II